jgi:hypothetical protein
VHQGAAAHAEQGFFDPVFSYRYDLYQRKPYPRAAASLLVKKLSAQWNSGSIWSGEMGVYLGVYPEIQNQKMLWPVLDVDGERKDTVSAIKRAQGLFRLLEEMDLTEHTVWLLSGTGFRVTFPFLLPIELRSGFKAFMQNLGDYGVDLGPYDSPDPPPIRMLCYRGHPSQRQRKDTVLDRHTVVVGPEELFSLTSIDDYHRFTRGKPDPELYRRWLPEILPMTSYSPGDGNLPHGVQRFLGILTDLQIQEEIKRNIFGDFDLPSQRASQRFDLNQVFEYLEKMGITWSDDERFIRLDRCPICGRRGTAWMTRWGRLKCFSSNCGASSAGGGLKAAEWVPGEHLEYEEESEPHREPPTFVDLSEAEASIAGHLRRDGNVALAVTPGVGKTRAGIMAAARGAEKGVIVYALPNHRLIGECMKRAEGLLHKKIRNFSKSVGRPEKVRDKSKSLCYAQGP